MARLRVAPRKVSGKGFNCHKQGHSPIGNIPEEIMVLDGFPCIGRICRFCRCGYFEMVSDKKVEISSVVDAEGKKLII